MADYVFNILNIWKPFCSLFSDMNHRISFILGTAMTYDRTLMHVKENFCEIQNGYHRADFRLSQVGPFCGQISVLNNVTWTWSCMNIVCSGLLMHVASFWNFGQRCSPCGQLHFPCGNMLNNYNIILQSSSSTVQVDLSGFYSELPWRPLVIKSYVDNIIKWSM